MLKNKPYEGKSEFGVYHLYSVEQDGEEKAYFATPELSLKIQGLGVKAGDEILLTKVATPNGKKIKSDVLVELLEHQRRIQSTTSGDRLKELMLKCLQEASELTRSLPNVPFQTEDVRAIASTLFIARK